LEQKLVVEGVSPVIKEQTRNLYCKISLLRIKLDLRGVTVNMIQQHKMLERKHRRASYD